MPCVVGRLSLRARIALFGTAMVALGVLGFAILVNALGTANQPLQQDRDLKQRAGEVARSIRLAGPDQLQPHGLALAAIDPGTDSELLVEVLDSSGALIYGNGAVGGSPPPVPPSLIRPARALRVRSQPRPASAITAGRGAVPTSGSVGPSSPASRPGL